MLLRNSELDRRLNCPGSFTVDGEIAYNEQSIMAYTGTAGHHALALAAVDDFDNPHKYAATAAERFDADFDDMLRVVYRGRDVWEDIKQHFPRPQAEHRVSGRVSKGTSDLVNIGGDLAVLDWKTGYGVVEHPNQLLGYADGLVQQFGMPARGYVYGVEAWVRLGTYREYKITQERLDQFVEDVEVAGKRKTYSAGPWCTFCPRRTNCAARQQLARASVDVLGVNATDGAIALTPADIGAVWERRGLIKKAVEDLEKLTKLLLREGTEIPLPDGRRLGFTESTRRTIDAGVAYDVLTGSDFDMSHADAMEAIGSAAGKSINKVVGDYADRGEKARDQKRAVRLIDEAGGVTKAISQKLAIFDAKEDSR